MRERHHHHHHHYHEQRGRDGYAYHAGDPGPGPNRHRLYKDMNNKVIFGVCAGIANYYGWRDPKFSSVGLGRCKFLFLPATGDCILRIVVCVEAGTVRAALSVCR